MGFSGIGKSDKGKALLEKCYKVDPLNPWNDAVSGWYLFFGGEFDLALNQAFAVFNLTPESGMNQFLKSLVLVYNDREEEAYEFLCKFVTEPAKDMWTQLAVFLKYVIKKDKAKLSSLLTTDFVKSIQIDPQNLYHMASFYSYLDEKEEALDYLEKAIGKGFVNYPFIASLDKLLNNIRGEERFKKLMERTRVEWENFEDKMLIFNISCRRT
jgi:non-specific serine/threonine protein kinase